MRDSNATNRHERAPSAACVASGDRVAFAADLRLLGMGLTVAAGLHGLGVRGVYIALAVLLMPVAVFLLCGYIAGRAGMVGTLAMAMGVSLLAYPSPLDVGTNGATPELLILSVVGMLAMMGSSWAEDLRPAPESMALKSLASRRQADRWARIDVRFEEPTGLSGPMGWGGASPGRVDAGSAAGGRLHARRELDRLQSPRPWAGPGSD